MGVDFIDYTYLQKRGIIKKEEELKSDSPNITSDGFIQMDSNSGSMNSSESVGGSPSSDFNPFGFLDNASNNQVFPSNVVESLPNVDKDLQIQGLKNKIEDLEYKLERLIEKFDLVENKLINFENKVR